MAEFKLGRIRFVWKNSWSAGNTYYQDDVVSFGGKMYICVIGHIAQENFFDDFSITPPKWNLVSDGQTWKGEWQPQVDYVFDDIVSYGARLYICNTPHTSASDSTIGLESDQGKWDIFAEGLDWKGAWSTNFDYKVNDLVKHGGQTYVCISAHISAATEELGLEQDISRWQKFNPGQEFKGTWTSEIRYKENDIVQYGSGLYIANTPHTSTTFAADSIYWTSFVQGLQFEGDWTPTRAYQPGDIVRYGPNQYVSISTNTGVKPQVANDDWVLFSRGLEFKGEWQEDSTLQEYLPGDIISYGGYSYVATAEHSNENPTNTSFWTRLSTGLRWRGAWLDDQEYLLGDIVRFGNNSYICILGHISEGDDFSTVTATEPGGGNENSRPDLDTSGTYWQVLTIGSEESVLTTAGDLIYYSGNGPARLPIGTKGQVLSVNSDDLPEWISLGSSEDVYYVAGHGVDEPAPINGLTIDRPFKTIRYACEQVEKGAKNPNARRLLELNRQFIQRETLEWIEQQVADGTDPFATDFAFDTNKCQRDIGYIIDAVINDITKGGNVKSREAALEYVNNASEFYTKGQEAETVAGINYALTIMQNVLEQTDPDVLYQVTRGDNSTAIVTQYKETGLQAEDVYGEIQGLVGIITDAITAGVATNIPRRIIKNVLIRVATGEYLETLPIIVPAETCVMGDELRSTKVQPRKASNSTLTPRTDSPFSYQAIVRLEETMNDIVLGQAVTPTTGNNIAQSQEWPYGEQIEADAATQLLRTTRRRIDHGLGDKIEADLKPFYEMSNQDLGLARDLILRNREFIQAEVIAFITNNYPDLSYSRTKCKQDVGYILDGLAYDLTYGGNWQITNAALAYFDGSSGNLQIDSEELTATLAAYNFLKSVIPVVGQDILETSPQQTAVEQIRGIGSSSPIAATTDPLFDEVVDIIENGPSAATVTYPDISSASSALRDAVEDISDNLATIKDNTIDFISKNFGSFRYDSGKCRRDLTNILTDISFDAAFNTNYNAIYNGIAYTRPNNAYNLQNQRVETVGAIEYAGQQAVISVTSDGSSQVGSTTYGNRVTSSIEEIVDIIQNGSVGTAEPGDGVVDNLVFTSPTGADVDRVAAKDQLQINKAYIRAEIVAYINKQISDNAANPGSIWYQFEYNSDKCSRDVGYIVDGLSYDMLYTGTMATTRLAESYIYDGIAYPEGQREQTAAAYDYLATVVSAVIRGQAVGPTTGNALVQDTGTYGDAGATLATEIDGKMQIIEDVITAGNLDSLPTVVYPDITAESAEIQAAKSSLDSDRTDIIRDTIQYINTTYNDFNFDHAKCSRDLGLIFEAASYDWLLSTNFASIVAAISYLRRPSAKVTGEQKEATLAANEFARQQIVALLDNQTAIAGVNSTWELVEDYIWSGSAEGGLKSIDNFNAFSAIRQIELNKDFLVAEVHAYIDDYFSDTVTATSSTTDALTISSTEWLTVGGEIRFVNADDSSESAGQAGVSADGDFKYYVRNIISDTEFTVSTDADLSTEVTLPDSQSIFRVESAYDYNIATCTRDVLAYLDAVKWDLQYPQEWKRSYTDGVTVHFPASYKTRLAARYYVNSVIGSQEEDMYYLRNGTGLRLQTLDGLQGDLSPNNEFGTKRPTAGAYASLDPGWGPDDERVWITARSPYVQNVSTFGFAATGQKIDGALHNGGNDSIVSNDFTQVISDGIGAHILNNGRAELVSVFTYYAHIGYLAESGGRIRATNGNNSYGTFGSVAEGVDPDETPVTAVVDNRTQFNADISNVVTNAEQILTVEYNHAGNNYTDANINFFGPGADEEIVIDDFRDNAVFQARLVNDPQGQAELGGDGFTVVQNTAQAGTTTSITLAATDGNPSTAYPGMKVVITGGAGTGQYGIIDTYNSGSKIATVLNPLNNNAPGWAHFVPGTTIVAPNASSTYTVEPSVTFAAPPSTSSAVTLPTSAEWRDIKFLTTAELYSAVSSTSNGDGVDATFNVIRTGSKYEVTLNTAGSGYSRLETLTIAGTAVGGDTPTHDITIVLTTVGNSGEIVEFESTGNGKTGRFIAVSSTTAGARSDDGTTWSALTLPAPAGTGYGKIAVGNVDDGSSALEPSFAVVTTNGNANVIYSTDGITWNSSSTGLTVTGETDVAFGTPAVGVGRFVVVNDANNDVAYSDDGGTSWVIESSALPFAGAGNVWITYGKGKYVAVQAGSGETAYSVDGISWTSGSTLATETWEDIAYGNNRFIAVASTNNASAYSLDGETWTAVTLPSVDGSSTNNYKQIEYGQGIFVATSDNSAIADNYNSVSTSEDGVYWTVQGVTPVVTAGMGPIGFGNPEFEGQFIAIDESNTTTAAVKIKVGARAKARTAIANQQLFEIRIFDPGSNYDPNNPPAISIVDPGNLEDAFFQVRVGNGVLAQPSFINRGIGFVEATADIDANNSNGFADFFQNGDFVAVKRLTQRPVPGSNVVFADKPDTVYKLVNTVSFLGDNDGSYTGFLQLSPNVEVADVANDEVGVEMRIRYSQVRLTGHDFLDIGTGNFVDTNYPGTPVNDPDPANETVDNDGGRVFFTATDQDGNFRVGPVFSVEQSTGVATLNAEAFNIAGLQELTLGEVTLGGNSASVTEFSTDPFFTADSDTVVPTQRAIKAYIEAQIGGGGASLNVNSITAGDIFINTNQITSVSGEPININTRMDFRDTVIGTPIAFDYFLR